jgi:hypothetical protein
MVALAEKARRSARSTFIDRAASVGLKAQL